MITWARGSSSSGRGTRHRNRGTQRAVTQTRYETRGTTQGTQREETSRGNQRGRASTSVSDPQPLLLSQEDLSKIAELIVRQLPTNSNAAQTTAAVLGPPTSSPAATVVQSSLTTLPTVVGTSTPMMAVTGIYKQVTAAPQMQVAVTGTYTQATTSEGALGQPPLSVPCKLLIVC